MCIRDRHSGMRTMNGKMIRAAIGKTGDSALKLVAVEYLNYMIEHPGEMCIRDRLLIA